MRESSLAASQESRDQEVQEQPGIDHLAHAGRARESATIAARYAPSTVAATLHAPRR
jgi:hypothetical protein